MIILIPFLFLGILAAQTGCCLHLLYCLAMRPKLETNSALVWGCVCLPPILWHAMILIVESPTAILETVVELSCTIVLVLTAVKLAKHCRNAQCRTVSVMLGVSAVICMAYTARTMFFDSRGGPGLLVMFPLASGVNYLLLLVLFRHPDFENAQDLVPIERRRDAGGERR